MLGEGERGGGGSEYQNNKLWVMPGLLRWGDGMTLREPPKTQLTMRIIIIKDSLDELRGSESCPPSPRDLQTKQRKVDWGAGD